MCEELHKLGLDADILFVDDNSPDGTGKLLEEIKPRFPRLIVQHRSGKLGIGSAHFEAIQWAYDQGYETVVSMDCDFTHSPSDIPAMIKAAEDCDISVGSRWAQENSLPGWNIFRRSMTWFGHFLTRVVLGIPQDASGAFRVYRLKRIPREVFSIIKSRGYSFFFESLFIFNRNGFKIQEVPIVLPARTYGHSKMSPSAALRSARYVFELAIDHIRKPENYLMEGRMPEIDPTMVDPQDWDSYWAASSGKSGALFELIAGIYRRSFIKRNLERAIHREFAAGSKLLHAGCGSGQVDCDLHRDMQITALDISPGALRRYVRNNARAAGIKHGSIFAIPFPDSSFDGVYNLGVMEHFTTEEIRTILREFQRVLKPGGKLLVFWPHAYASSVMVLGAAHFILNRVLGKKTQLHPAEITHCRGRRQMEELFRGSDLSLCGFRFGPDDLFVQAVVTAKKNGL